MMVLEERLNSNGQGKGMKISQGPMSCSKTVIFTSVKTIMMLSGLAFEVMAGKVVKGNDQGSYL